MEVDYWSERETIWKGGRIQGITKTGEAYIKDTNTGDTRLIDSCSRGLSKLHYFTKKEVREPLRRDFSQVYGNLPLMAGNQFYNPIQAELMGNFMLYMHEPM